MPPICVHKNGPIYGETKGEDFILGKHCRQCWLYLNDEAARAKWDNDPNVIIISLHDTEKIKAMGIQIEEPSQIPITEGPSWFRKALNFGKAIVKHVWHGLPETPTEEQKRRLSICLQCPLLDPESGICKHEKCGCAVAKKTTWLMEACPLEKW